MAEKTNRKAKTMKNKIMAITSLLALAAASTFAGESPAKEINSLADISVVGEALSKFSASAAVGYESEFIFRGKQLAGAAVCPQVDASYDIGAGFGTYVGWWGCYSTDGFGYGENDLYAGLTYSVADFTFDFGYTAYTYPADGSVNEHELKFCVSYDTSELLGDFAISPYVAGYYNLTYSGTTIEAGISYSAPITKWILGDNWGSIDIAAFGGYADYIGGMVADRGGYAYAGFKADAVVKVNEYCSAYAGIRYACNNDGDGGAVAVEGRENNLWFGTGVSFGF